MLLKNVQDGISRPLGNQAFQKTKVETDLLDTLYNVSLSIHHFDKSGIHDLILKSKLLANFFQLLES